MFWLVVSLMLSADVPTPTTGDAYQARSANFHIYSQSHAHDARQVAQHAEQWRDRLNVTWSVSAEAKPWPVPCLVVIHATRESYIAAVGPGGRTSLGSSWIELAGGNVGKRRLDLIADRHGELTALAHELTHAVVADRFEGKQLPRWADEGMAILADSPQKRSLHQRDLEEALTNRQAFSCGEMLALADYPNHSRIPAFYGQSASLVAFLCQRKTPADFIRFVVLSQQQGNDAALQEVYGIRGMAELERHWRGDLAAAIDFHGFHIKIADNTRSPKAIVE